MTLIEFSAATKASGMPNDEYLLNRLKYKELLNKKKAPKDLLKAERQFPATPRSAWWQLTKVDDRLGDRAFGFDGFGVRLVVALRHDQVD